MSELAVNLATVAAIAVGGAWTYGRFVRERPDWPRAKVELETSHHVVHEDLVAIHAKVKVENSGNRLMRIESVRIDLHSVVPLRSRDEPTIPADSLSFTDPKDTGWPALDQRRWSWEKQDSTPSLPDDHPLTPSPKLEPSESDEFTCDFLVPADTSVVFLYAYVSNDSKEHDKGKLGWPVTTFYEISDQPVPHLADNQLN